MIFRIHEKIKDDENFFFQYNKLFPWAQVSVFRVNLNCETSDFIDDECVKQAIYNLDFNEEPFNGYDFVDYSYPFIRTKHLSMMQGGNRKSLKIYDYETKQSTLSDAIDEV